MWKMDDLDDVACSANDRRWKCLSHLAMLLSEGMVELEDLVMTTNQEKENLINADWVLNLNQVLDRGFLIKGKRKPRKKRILSVNPFAWPVIEQTEWKKFKKPTDHGKKSNRALSFDAVCTQESVFKKMNFKKPTDHGISKNLDMRNPICIDESLNNLDRNLKKRRLDYSENEEKMIKKRNVDLNLPEAFKNRILDSGGCLESAVLVIEKGLFKTDVSKSHGRLSVPHGKVRNQFLTLNEVDRLDSADEIQATLVQPCLDLEECKISLRNWKSNSMYALVSGWNEVCESNSLTEGMMVQLWAFRRNSNLCFALVRTD